ncbi:peptidase [Altererythrobacter sp. B11]|uniref:Mov34/MPN/PAD-1 family protein n=1 Tax=Altererythrobacter sp. B11 TaxID=2060312 RepID=UPI000DC738D7|nr:M67 family metallopeptidase [Altererythrobacter sp. B11]BBC74227.1 peptidase [Altererythrobacter sp. B11]
MELRVTRAVLEQIRAHAARAAPEECCGLLLGRNGKVMDAQPTANIAADRRRYFELDPQALIDAHRLARAGGPDILGYYHSHPHGPASPSATDAAMAAGDGRVWAIAANGDVTFWRDGEDGFARVSYVCPEG